MEKKEIDLCFWYHGHFNQECEPFSYLMFCLSTNGQKNTINNRKFVYALQHGHPSDLDYESGKISHTEWLIRCRENIDKHTQNVKLSIDDVSSIQDVSIVVYLFANTYLPVSTIDKEKKMVWQRPVERRTDELIIPLCECFKDDQMNIWLSPMKKFTLGLHLKSSILNPSIISIPSLIDIVGSEETKSKRKHARERLHQITLHGNEQFFLQGPKYKWLSKYVRICNTSYVYLPCTSSIIGQKEPTALPGWAFPYAYERMPELPSEEFYLHQFHLALKRMNLTQRDEIPKTTLLEIIVEMCCWPVRLANYMNDSSDSCSTMGGPAVPPYPPGSLKEMKEMKEMKEKMTGLMERLKIHKIIPTDQFASLWNGIHPERSADDCESFAIACYVMVRGLQKFLSEKTTSKLSFLSIIQEYVPVIATVTIPAKQSKHKESISLESKHDDEDEIKSGTLFNGQAQKDHNLVCHVVLLLIPSVRLKCWLQRGIDYMEGKRGLNRKSVECSLPNLLCDATEYAVGQQDMRGPAVPPYPPGSVSDIHTEKPYRKGVYEGLVPHGGTAGPFMMYVRDQDWMHVKSSFDAWMKQQGHKYTTEKDKAFEKMFYHTIHVQLTEDSKNPWMPRLQFISKFMKQFPESSLFILKVPEPITENWNSYLHIIDGLSIETQYPHFIFFNLDTEQRARSFADVMTGSQHDSQNSNLACLPVGTALTDDIKRDLDFVLQDEPHVAFPPWR